MSLSFLSHSRRRGSSVVPPNSNSNSNSNSSSSVLQRRMSLRQEDADRAEALRSWQQNRRIEKSLENTLQKSRTLFDDLKKEKLRRPLASRLDQEEVSGHEGANHNGHANFLGDEGSEVEEVDSEGNEEDLAQNHAYHNEGGAVTPNATARRARRDAWGFVTSKIVKSPSRPRSSPVHSTTFLSSPSSARPPSSAGNALDADILDIQQEFRQKLRGLEDRFLREAHDLRARYLSRVESACAAGPTPRKASGTSGEMHSSPPRAPMRDTFDLARSRSAGSRRLQSHPPSHSQAENPSTGATSVTSRVMAALQQQQQPRRGRSIDDPDRDAVTLHRSAPPYAAHPTTSSSRSTSSSSTAGTGVNKSSSNTAGASRQQRQIEHFQKYLSKHKSALSVRLTKSVVGRSSNSASTQHQHPHSGTHRRTFFADSDSD